MLDKFLVLLERFVVAHELIAKNSGGVAVKSEAVESPVKEAEEKPAKGKRATAKKAPAKEAEPEDDDESEEKPKRGRGKAAAGGKDIRGAITALAKSMIDDGSDDCIDDFDDLLEEFDAKTVKDVTDEDLEDFFDEIKDVAGKYFEEKDLKELLAKYGA